MELTKAITIVRPSIVQINFSAFNISPEISKQIKHSWIVIPIGTGFIVNPEGYVITANHVIQDGLEQVQSYPAETKKLSIGFPEPNTETMRGNFTLVDFEIIDEDSVHDLALLKLKKNPFKDEVKSMFGGKNNETKLRVGAATLNIDRPEDGISIAISGYPLSQSVLISNGGFLATAWDFNIQDVYIPGAPEYFKTPKVVDSYLADVNINPGNSGGPAYKINDGSIIGVCVAYLPTNIVTDQENFSAYYNSGLSVIVPSRYIVDLLNKHQLSWVAT